MAMYLVLYPSEVSFSIEKHPKLFVSHALKHSGNLFRMKEALFKEITKNIKWLLLAASSTYKNNHSVARTVVEGVFLSASWEF